MDIGGDAVIIGNAEQIESDQPTNLNISDVFEAISLADPTFGAGVAAVDEAMAHQPPQMQAPCVRIVEQPASKALRFRYECEGRSAGSIPGASSTPENRTYPTVKIHGYTGLVTIVVSCVTKDEPFRPHPHNLVGRDRCDRGVCTIRTEITEENNEYQFRNLGIQCVKRRDIAEALKVREDLRVDPFRTGFGHRNHPQSIDLNAVRLGFQVFLPDSSGKMRRSLAPVASDVIYDKKAMSDLLIMRASHCSGSARGGNQLILLCEKVTREDTAVVFYQEENNQVVWEETAIIALVHKQVAIAFETPPYRDPQISKPVNVRFQLKRITDNSRSNPMPFEYYPDYQDPNYIGSKRRKTLIPVYEMERFQQEQKQIKIEPRDKTPPHQMSMSPTLNMYAQYAQQNWQMNIEMQGGLSEAGPSHMPVYQDMPWTSPYGQNLVPNMQQTLSSLSPNMQAHTSNMQAHSPNMQVHSPNMQVHSPNMHVHSPIMQANSPHQIMSPSMAQSPHQGGMSPMCMSPMQAGHVSPNIVQQADYTQMVQHDNTLDNSQRSMPSVSALLLDRDGSIQLSSSEISGLASLLNVDRNADLLSSDLNKLTTSDLLL